MVTPMVVKHIQWRSHRTHRRVFNETNNNKTLGLPRDLWGHSYGWNPYSLQRLPTSCRPNAFSLRSVNFLACDQDVLSSKTK